MAVDLHHATTHEILLELRQCQARLGTDHERLHDYDRVCDLAHLLSNRLTAAMLLEELARGR